MAKATGAYSSVEGNVTEATFPPSHSEGSYCLASGTNSHAEGNSTLASDDNARAIGVYSIASRHAQFSVSSGEITQSPGEAQYCQEYMMVKTTDTNPHNLLIANGTAPISGLVFENDKSYAIRLLIVARGNAAGFSKTWKCVCGAKMNGAILSRIGALAPTVTVVSEDGGTTAGWSVTVDVNAGTSSLDIIGTSGANISINWVAFVDWVEVYLSLPH